MDFILPIIAVICSHVAAFYIGRSVRWGEIAKRFRSTAEMYHNAATMFRRAEKELKASTDRDIKFQEDWVKYGKK